MKKPNIVYILADDMGYGDVECYNPNCKAPTPYLNQLAKDGIRYSDAHTSSAVCTPTRYSILKGRYNWRSSLKRGVLGGASPMLLEEGEETVATMLKKNGYQTACIGKWHLGLDWQLKDEEENTEEKDDLTKGQTRIEYSKPVTSSPNDFGFDYSFIIPSSLDIPPYVYLENGLCTGIPSETNKLGVDTPYLMRAGMAVPGMKAIDVLPTFAKKVDSYIDEHAHQDDPFFVYFPLTAPHTPIIPAEECQNRTEVGPYGDFVTQIDDLVGGVVEALKRNGIEEETWIIFTSDNGASPAAKLDELSLQGHEANHPWRGHKADLYEGGHRVPYIMKWPNGIEAGLHSDSVKCTTDFYATAAEVVGHEIAYGEGEDSYSFVPEFKRNGSTVVREATVHHSVSGHFAIRKGKWKLLEAYGSGGWSYPNEELAKGMKLPELQLYNLEEDPRESMNIASGHPEIIQELQELLGRYQHEGRSR